ncbi:MAG: 23S rRNA (pseudouridine(1915)-N(3))-methyltransferase RlmH [Blastocatellia bacterium]
MKLRFIWIGKTRSAPVRELIEDYFGRIRRFAQFDVTELRDAVGPGSDPVAAMETEGERILESTKPDPFVVLLDETGRQFRSAEFAEVIREHMGKGTKRMTFVIGGHMGSSPAVKERADLVLSLSRMTFTHEIARALLAEQVYRAFTIVNNLPYQK